MSFFEIYAVIQWFIIGIIFLNFAAFRYFSSQEVMNEFLECSMCSPMNVFFQSHSL